MARVAVVLSLAFFASAAAEMIASEPSPPSLRGGRSLSDATPNATGPLSAIAGEPVAADPAAAFEQPSNATPGNASAVDAAELASEMPLLGSSWGGWSQGGDKIWGAGSGMESINRGNVGYYDQGMAAAHGRCADAGCALITNPAGHRTVDTFHIHFVHYHGYGRSLKRRMESQVCGTVGAWRGGGLPCGGRAAFFPGFPGVFSKAMTGGSIRYASVIAWPGACGGRGTIVELAYHCSIEHQIRGDYDPSRR